MVGKKTRRKENKGAKIKCFPLFDWGKKKKKRMENGVVILKPQRIDFRSNDFFKPQRIDFHGCFCQIASSLFSRRSYSVASMTADSPARMHSSRRSRATNSWWWSYMRFKDDETHWLNQIYFIFFLFCFFFVCFLLWFYFGY